MKRLPVVLLLFASVEWVSAQPALAIRGAAQNTFEVSWPADQPDYQLEAATALDVAANWLAVLSGPVQNGDRLVVQIVAGPRTQFFRLHGPDLTSIESTSPFDGETDVAVTRETIISFSAPLAKDTILDSDHLYGIAAGRKILSRIELSSDLKRVSLFYLEPLPGSAQVNVYLDPEDLFDDKGRQLDRASIAPDGNILSFQTLSLTPLANTAVIGTVYAANLEGPTGTNMPLAGVTITVDGMEQTLRTVTDVNGKFKLSPVPPGRFFVHIDGRTVTNIALGLQYPDKNYYPFVGKAWDAVAGREDNPAGGTGTIYLPLIISGTLQPVSQTVPTKISFPTEVVATNPSFAGVSITVPPNSLFNDNGTRGGKVGIAPVPPDRLPGPLPLGLEMPIVITVQTDGALNFDQPAPVCFPNLPDPVLGAPLPAGSKQALMSFNHRKGVWEAVGTMTVSADGKLVCSDPGSGILQPGWHGVGPQPDGPPPPPCDGGNGAQSLSRLYSVHAQGNLIALDKLEDCKKNCETVWKEKDESIKARWFKALTNCQNTWTVLYKKDCPYQSGIAYSFNYELKVNNDERVSCLKRCTFDFPKKPKPIKRPPVCRPPKKPSSSAALKTESFHALATPASAEVVQQILAISEQMRTLVDNNDPSKEWPPDVAEKFSDLLKAADALAGGSAAHYLGNYLLQKEIAAAANGTLDEPDGNAPDYPVLYVAEILRPDGLFYLRGKTEPFGQYQLFVPRDGSIGSVHFYDPQTKSYGSVVPRLRPDAPWRLPSFEMYPLDEGVLDYDHDGLPDIVELVYGTDRLNPDSDGDGIPDGAEVDQNTNPLDGRAVNTGIIAGTSTVGPAVDVTAADDLIVTAEGSQGVSIFSPFNGSNPVMLGHLDTRGNAQRVSVEGSLLAVADGPGGLAVIDIDDPSKPTLKFTKGLGNAQSVALNNGVAYLGFTSGLIAALNANNQTLGAELFLNGPVQDLIVSGDYLYALTGDSLYTLSLGLYEMKLIGQVQSPFVSSPNTRLFVGGGTAYAVHGKGYNTIDVSDPAKPVLIKASNTQQFGWRQIVPNGSGLGLAPVGPNLSDDGAHDVSLYDLTSRTNTDVFITTFVTPGHATAVAILNGLAYVADREGGLQVLNYLPYDAKKVVPTIALRTGFGSESEEGKRARVTAEVSDDVQVRNVIFYIDGVAQKVDGSYPFEFAFTVPPRTPAKTSFVVRALATDTGGNSTWSPEVSVGILPDTTAPTVVRAEPQSGAALMTGTTRVITAYFSELIDAASVTPNAVALISAGNDEVLGTSDDVDLSGTLSYNGDLQSISLTFSQALGAGHYRLKISGIRDLAGNALSQPFAADFAVVKNYFITYGRTDGTNGTIWQATSDGALDQQITTGFQPRLSPDGRYLAFRRAASPNDISSANIYLRDMASGAERLLHTYGGGVLNSFDWRSDSRRIIYDEGGTILQQPIDSGGPQNLLVGANGWDDGPAANPVTDAFAFWNVLPGNAEAGIHLANADGTGRTLVAGTTINDFRPAWSPDGEWLSFWRMGTDKGYYKIRPGGTELARLTSGFESSETSPAIWAPDQRALLAPLKTNGVQQLYAISADGAGAPTRIPLHQGDNVWWVGTAQVTPFAVKSSFPESERVYSVGWISGLTAQFSHALNASSVGPSSLRVISPGVDGIFGNADDQTVAGETSMGLNGAALDFIPATELSEGKYRAEINGSIRDVAGTTLGTSYTWNFEVKKLNFLIAYGRTGPAEGTIWLTSNDGSFDRQVTTGERPRLSPDGRQMLFMRGGGSANFYHGNLYVRDLTTGAEKLKFDVRGDFTVGFDWQDGTNHIVFDWSCAIYRFQPDNTAPLFVGGDCYDDAPSASPHDGRVAFHNSNGLSLTDANGANKRKLPNTQPGDYWPQWSPDGEWISFYRTAGTNIFKIRPDGSELTPLTNRSDDAKNSFANALASWSPDGTGVFAVGIVNGVQGIYFIDANGLFSPKAIKTSAEADLDAITSVIIAPTDFAPK